MVYAVLFVHWIADFICQTRSMANNKSKSGGWLLAHILTYTLIMSVFGLRFAVINGAMHFATDFCTSRLTSHYWRQQNVHAFFCVIGFDQFLHTIVLLWSIPYAHGIIPRLIQSLA